jgi:hypothetical protein
MQGLIAVLQNFVDRLRDLFLKSFGDPNSSSSGDVNIPIDTNAVGWFPGPAISVCSKVFLQNLDEENDAMIAVNNQFPVGWRLVAGKGIVIDNFQGQIFVRCVDSGVSIDLNYMAIGLKQN